MRMGSLMQRPLWLLRPDCLPMRSAKSPAPARRSPSTRSWPRAPGRLGYCACPDRGLGHALRAAHTPCRVTVRTLRCYQQRRVASLARPGCLRARCRDPLYSSATDPNTGVGAGTRASAMQAAYGRAHEGFLGGTTSAAALATMRLRPSRSPALLDQSDDSGVEALRRRVGAAHPQQRPVGAVPLRHDGPEVVH